MGHGPREASFLFILINIPHLSPISAYSNGKLLIVFIELRIATYIVMQVLG